MSAEVDAPLQISSKYIKKPKYVSRLEKRDAGICDILKANTFQIIFIFLSGVMMFLRM